MERVSSCRHTIRLLSAKLFYLLVKCNIFFRSAICIGNIACCLANCMFARVCLNIGTFYFTWILDSKLLLLGIQRSREDSWGKAGGVECSDSVDPYSSYIPINTIGAEKFSAFSFTTVLWHLVDKEWGSNCLYRCVAVKCAEQFNSRYGNPLLLCEIQTDGIRLMSEIGNESFFTLLLSWCDWLSTVWWPHYSLLTGPTHHLQQVTRPRGNKKLVVFVCLHKLIFLEKRLTC